jgi:ubiquinone/menaquinone biosynthesis C-methylase UbiE
MIEQANLLRQQMNLYNIKYEIGDVTHLPYDDGSFSIVITRYSFHHLVDPYLILNEMKRVCIPKGRVVVIDVTLSDSSFSEAQGATSRSDDKRNVLCI